MRNTPPAAEPVTWLLTVLAPSGKGGRAAVASPLPSPTGETPLHLCSSERACCSLLIGEGALLEERDASGFTPLQAPSPLTAQLPHTEPERMSVVSPRAFHRRP